MKVTFIQPVSVRSNAANRAISRSIELPAIPEVGDYAHDKFLPPTPIEKTRVNLDTRNFECIISVRQFDTEKDLAKFLVDLEDAKGDWSLVQRAN